MNFISISLFYFYLFLTFYRFCILLSHRGSAEKLLLVVSTALPLFYLKIVEK